MCIHVYLPLPLSPDLLVSLVLSLLPLSFAHTHSLPLRSSFFRRDAPFNQRITYLLGPYGWSRDMTESITWIRGTRASSPSLFCQRARPLFFPFSPRSRSFLPRDAHVCFSPRARALTFGGLRARRTRERGKEEE